MTASVDADLLPLVEPAWHTAPAYEETLGPEVADICQLAAFPPDLEQQLILDDVFALDPVQPRSAAFEIGVICARQNLKTGSFKQCALGWLFVSEVNLVVWSAHEFDTASEAHRDLAGLIENCDDLRPLLKSVIYANGKERIELHHVACKRKFGPTSQSCCSGGQRVVFKARTKTGGRGLSGDKVVLDEGFALHPAHLAALMPTLSVRPDPQILYGSSAGLADSDTLRGVRDRGRKGISRRLAYIEWAAKRRACELETCDHEVGRPGCILDDRLLWKDANPLLGRVRANGTGLTFDYVAAERDAMPPHEFGRERMGWWDEPGAADAFGAGKWEACAGSPPPLDLPVGALAVAASYDLRWGTISAAAVDEADVAHGVPLDHRPGTDWMIERALELQRQYGGVDVVIDGGGPAADLIPKMVEAGVSLRVLDTGDVLDACAVIWKRVQDRRFRHAATYTCLQSSAASAVPRTVGDRWAWGRKQSDADISALEGVTFAVWLAEQGMGESWFAFD